MMLALSRQQPLQPTDRIPKQVLLKVIYNIKQGKLTSRQILDALEQFVVEYEESNKVVSIFTVNSRK